MEDKQLYEIYISGYVQGVGFRWSAAREANKLGITGYVRNLSDGRVYIEAEGLPDMLRAFISWCHRGPAGGLVESVDTELSAPEGYREFLIRH